MVNAPAISSTFFKKPYVKFYMTFYHNIYYIFREVPFTCYVWIFLRQDTSWRQPSNGCIVSFHTYSRTYLTHFRQMMDGNLRPKAGNKFIYSLHQSTTQKLLVRKRNKHFMMKEEIEIEKQCENRNLTNKTQPSNYLFKLYFFYYKINFEKIWTLGLNYCSMRKLCECFPLEFLNSNSLTICSSFQRLLDSI